MNDRIPFPMFKNVKCMLATLVKKPFHKDGWVYEEKYDGYRILAYKEGRRVTLLSRNSKDRTATFSVIAEAVARLPSRTLLLDGEVVAFDSHRVSRFQLLQNMKAQPSYAVFDCLYRNGLDLRRAPLAERREAVEAVIERTAMKRDRIFPSARLAPDGLKAFQLAKDKGYEGMVAKDASAPYIEGRSNKWLKVKAHQEDEFLIVGYTQPAGARKHFGALLLGAYVEGELRYVGKVGTGFDNKTLAKLFRKLQPLVRETPSVTDPPRERGAAYVRPHLVAEIAYEELTADQKLRQPVYLGLRDDKRPQDVTLPEAR
jgi:bifunctional non-homologous end joining protein LigD